jgi:hypothetical protein
MKARSWIKAFDDFSPLPFSSVGWLCATFVLSGFWDGLQFSLTFSLFISVIVFNTVTLALMLKLIFR